ncbi:uncharacterized protein RSE6_09352 [Rhynchosporium secalis]|uniref:Uncharacterized protein n=1 Tax=Rhynchosporium secalis TaxID=38038 RepID=A0A1E1MHT9_RHYSE|nr:uncharacterized protein RSE6_09352 [Rhynchosporium secalis]
MPRPKRTKVAPSAPAPRVKTTTKLAPPVAAAPKLPIAQFDDLYDVSDEGNGRASSARHVTRDNGKGKAVAGSSSRGRGGGINSRDSIDRDPETLENRLEQDRIVAEDPVEESLLPDIDLNSSSPSMETGRKEQRTPAIESSMLAIGNFRRRPRQPSILGRGPGRARSSSIDSNMAEDNGLMSVGRNNKSAMKNGNFKRRPREQSIMGRNAAHVAPSSMALDMETEKDTTTKVGSAMKIGTFKRREREPSILRTAQKARREEPLDYDDDEDDFNPEDESTPLNLTKTRNMTSSSSGPSSSNSRKRKLSVVQVPRSSPSLPSPRASEAHETIPATGPLSDDGEVEAEPSPPLLPSIEARFDTPEPLSETMAPPQSSSPLPSSPELPSGTRRAPSRGRHTLRGRTPPPRTQDSPISSPPSLTHSPNRPAHAAVTARKPQKQAPPPSNFSTAQLQNLLPRRRQRATARDLFDVPSSGDEVDVSGLAPDDDELSHLNVHARSRRHTSVRARTPAPAKRGGRVNRADPKPKDSTVKRTYGSRTNAASDKENDAEVDPDDSLAPIPDNHPNDPENSQELEERVGKELKRAAKKFQEVDKWELEFEEVTASSSSPRDAR